MDRPTSAPAPSGPPRTGSARRPPSGRQLVIGHGAERLVVTEVGGGIRSYTVDDEAVLDGYDVDALCSGGRGQVLAPWPNRLGDGRYRFGDRTCRLALDEPGRGNAIHGLVRWLAWEVRAQAQNVLSMGCVLQPQPGYPWRIDVEVEYRLGRGGLVVSAEATNLDEEPAPFGIGFHPYLTVGTATVDSARLQLGAGHVLRTDERGLPVGTAPVGGSEFDFRTGRPIGPTRLDTCFGDLARDGDGLARVELAHPDRDRQVALWMDRSFGYVMAYTGDTVQPEERRRRSLAVEPMSCPPDAFRSGEGLVTLAPGESFKGTWGIEVRR